MNKSFLKILTFSLLSFIMLMGCAALEDKPVPDPKPFVTEKNTPLDMNNLDTFIGNYKPSVIVTDPLKSEIDIDYLNGIINIFPNKTNNTLEYNYAVYNQGYKDNGSLTVQPTLTPLGNVTIDETTENDRSHITLTNPIIINTNGNTYKISALRKIADTMTNVTDSTTEEEVTKSYTVCDPLIGGNEDPNSCTNVDGAMKYIGYYRIESITCNSQPYYGGTDFAGEMVVNPSLASNIVDVIIPITVKVQVENNSPLKQCLLTTDEQASNMYYKTNSYKLTGDDYSGGLNSAFEKVGLIGLKDNDVTIRTTQIDYNPKDTNYSDMTFGDSGNKVTMRLKFIQNSSLNLLPVVQIKNTNYFTK